MENCVSFCGKEGHTSEISVEFVPEPGTLWLEGRVPTNCASGATVNLRCTLCRWRVIERAFVSVY